MMFLIFLLPHLAYSESTTNCENGTILNSTGQCVLQCGHGTIIDNSTGQCVLQCGEGTIVTKTGTCIEEWRFGFGQLEAIGIGILVGLGATLFGVGWTIKLRHDEKKREDLDLIQSYGDKLSEINYEEKNLETKLDCALYAER